MQSVWYMFIGAQDPLLEKKCVQLHHCCTVPQALISVQPLREPKARNAPRRGASVGFRTHFLHGIF